MKLIRRPLSGGSCLSLGLALMFAPPFSGLAQSMKEDFAWLDTLGFPDTGGLALKRIESRGVSDRVTYGFHLEEKKDPEHIWLLAFDLIPRPIPRKSVGTVEAMGLEVYAKRLLDQSDPAQFSQARGETPWEVTFPNRSHACIVAWLAAKRGLDSIAESLYQRARELPPREVRWTRPDAGKPQLTFRQSLEMEIARTLMSQILRRIGSPFLSSGLDVASRPEMLEAFEHYQRCFPESRDAKFVGRAIEILRQMIAEDADHEELTPEQLGRLPVEQQVEEWLYRMREERGDLSGDGDCYVRSRDLVKLGYPAVPRLIEALDDDRFTRGIRVSSGLWGNWAQNAGVRVVRVGDVAASALIEIARDRFPDTPFVYVGDQSPKAIEQRKQFAGSVRDWWTSFQKIGEEQMLVDGVRRGGRGAVRKVDLLVRSYPDRAFDAIVAGLEVNAEDSYVRKELLESLAHLRSGQSDAFFLRVANEDPDLSCRAFSAQTLFRRGKQTEAVAAMVKVWRHRDQWLSQGDNNAGNSLLELIRFLVSCNDPGVIEEIEGDFDSLVVDLRYTLVEQLSLVRDFMARKGKNQPLGYSREFGDAVVSLLAGALRDDAIRWHLGEIRSPDRRVADAAVRALSHWRPEVFPRQLHATFRQREWARLKTLTALSREENVSPPVQPSWLGKKNLKSVNQVVGIEVRGLLGENPPAWFEPLPTLVDSELDIDLLCRVFNGFAKDEKIAGKTLVVSAIRFGDRPGVFLIADLYPNLHSLPGESILQTRNSMGSWHSYKDRSNWEDHHAETADNLKEMLRDAGKEELRLRLVLMKR